ncbi:MAG: flagellar hook protein FlgE [Desulfuromonas sp.]|uniref:flagellar hook protein FlgE n=1 Tax=Desulfuromonas sp. TaxID=892 RepID=UPI000CC10D4B|nr:flagellar hook protein FlgE [Desulfuromonas sp.]PLX84491.1 MAG: flagellar hook protein FlgE [Desulfuromonas sp.]
MGIMTSLFSGVSGLTNNGNAMTVIGNNIANNNTIGFKGGRVLFSDLLSSQVSGSGGTSQVGRGVGLSVVDNLFTQGTFENTASNTDMAIEGEGFFIAQDPITGNDLYTRAGAFRFDAGGNLITPEGYQVQGYALNDAGEISGELTDIQVDMMTLSAPKMTGNMTLTTNLDADATYHGAFPTTDANGGYDPVALNNATNYATSTNVYDSLGNSHPVTVWFSKMDPATNPLEWEYHATVDGRDIGLTNPDPNADPDAPYPVEVTTGTVTFDADGNLLSQNPDPPMIPGGSLAWDNNADQNQEINLNFNTTQYSSASVVISQSQDGYTTGNVATLSVDNEGYVLGNYSNGLPKRLFQVALAKFSNPAGLVKEGNNMYGASVASGDSVVGTVGSGIGKIFTNALERSNVDLAQEFVSMITTQRGFQASSKIITTTDEMLNELINLKR